MGLKCFGSFGFFLQFLLDISLPVCDKHEKTRKLQYSCHNMPPVFLIMWRSMFVSVCLWYGMTKRLKQVLVPAYLYEKVHIFWCDKLLLLHQGSILKV